MYTRADAPPEGTQHSPFRDDAIIAEGRRERLLVRRREELATVPDALRSVYVARAARAASALLIAMFMAALIAAAAVPAVASAVASVVPGRNPAVLSSLLFAALVGGSLTYFLARARAERRFARTLARAVAPTGDARADVERLTKLSPKALGLDLARRRELAAIGLPMLAAAVLVPCAAIYACMALVEWGYPRPAAFDDTLAAFAPQLVAGALLGIAAASMLAPRLLRLGGNQLVQVRNTAFVILVPALPLAIWGLVDGTALASWTGGAAAALSLLVVLAAQRVQSERARLGIADEVTVAALTLKDLIRSARNAALSVPAFLNPFTLRRRLTALSARVKGGSASESSTPSATVFSRPLPKMIAAASIAAILGTVAYSSISPVIRDASAADSAAFSIAAQPHTGPRLVPIASGPTTVRVVPDLDDQRDGLVVEVQFRDGDPAEWSLPLAQPGAGFGWRFAISVTLLDTSSDLQSDDSPRLLLSPFLGEDFSSAALPVSLARPVAVFNKLACSEDLGLGLRIVPQGAWAHGTHTVRLRYEPFFSLADTCD